MFLFGCFPNFLRIIAACNDSVVNYCDVLSTVSSVNFFRVRHVKS